MNRIALGVVAAHVFVACAGSPGPADPCGNCRSGEHCRDGVCIPDDCQSPYIWCDGVCTDGTSDPANCGRCGSVCRDGRACIDGVCLCAQGTQACDGTCVNTQADSHNCGVCGHICPSGQWCANGSCGCSANLNTDPTNCGQCGNRCPSGYVCSSGQCKCSLNLNTDNMNCGSCGHRCASDQTCVSGTCKGSLGADCSTTSCAQGYLCVYDYGDQMPRCRLTCSSSSSNCHETCPTGTTCTYVTDGNGNGYRACLGARPNYAPCGCDYGQCAAGNFCVDFSGTSAPNGYCMWMCSGPSDCSSSETCQAITNGPNACLPTRNGGVLHSICVDILGGALSYFGVSSLCSLCYYAVDAIANWCDGYVPALGGYVCEWLGNQLCDYLKVQTNCAAYNADWACTVLGF
jgi:hypothetical protein